MSSALETIAAKMAEECIAVMKETGDDRLFMEMSTVIGESSQTLEEAFLTEVRVRMSEVKGREFLKRKLKEHRAKQQNG